MKRLLVLGLCCAAFQVQAERPARVTVVSGDDVAANIVAVSFRDEAVAAGRLTEARTWLDQVVKATGEEEKAVAAQCERTARWFFDLTRRKATALEMLEALARLGKPGTPMQDTLLDYVAVRRATPGMTHAEALSAKGKVGG